MFETIGSPEQFENFMKKHLKLHKSITRAYFMKKNILIDVKQFQKYLNASGSVLKEEKSLFSFQEGCS